MSCKLSTWKKEKYHLSSAESSHRVVKAKILVKAVNHLYSEYRKTCKNVPLWHMWTAKVQISMCVHVIWSGSSLTSYRIFGYYRTYTIFYYENTSIQIQWNLDNSKSKDQTVVWITETLNNWGLKCIHILKSGLQNDFELLRILNYWSLNYRGSTVHRKFHLQKLKIFR